ncbi:MAG: hypothetical protein ACYC23_01540 [Limisphaerales bacterium]
MKTHRSRNTSALPRALVVTLAATGTGALAAEPPAASSAPKSPWNYTATAAAKGFFDSNVYLQERGPLAHQESWGVSVLPQVGVSYHPGPEFKATLSYTPDFTFFEATPDEDYFSHKTALNFSGKAEPLSWEFNNALVFTDGNSTNLIYGLPGGPPAAGAIPVRDRRDATIYRNGVKLLYPFKDWFLRPVAATYLHDFRSRQSTTPGYQNYADRKEISGGLDIGRKLTGKFSTFVGYRYGWQDQEDLLDRGIAYDNHFQRVLAGFEGQLLEWLKLNVAVGPDFRQFGDQVAPGFDRSDTVVFLDAAAVITPMAGDTITLSGKRFQQPGFGGRSIYDDSTYELLWRHTFARKFTVGLGFRAYQTDFTPSAPRNDWIFTYSALAGYAFNAKLGAEASYSFDDGFSHLENLENRDFTRHLVAVGVRYSFK